MVVKITYFVHGTTTDNTRKQGGNYYAQKNIGRANIEVVYEKDKYIKVITIYYIQDINKENLQGFCKTQNENNNG